MRILLITDNPCQAFPDALRLLYPNNHWTRVIGHEPDTTVILPSALIKRRVAIEPTAVIGPEGYIGQGTRIGVGAIIGYRRAIGENYFDQRFYIH